MFIGYFTERPYQDREAEWYKHFGGLLDLGLSNSNYKPEIGADLYNRYFDEKLYVEEMGFDWVSLSEHHYSPRILTPSPVLPSGVGEKCSPPRARCG